MRWLEADSEAPGGVRELFDVHVSDPSEERLARLTTRLAAVLGPAVLGGAAGGLGVSGAEAGAFGAALPSAPPPALLPPPLVPPPGVIEVGIGLGKTAGVWSAGKLAVIGAVASASIVGTVAMVKPWGGSSDTAGVVDRSPSLVLTGSPFERGEKVPPEEASPSAGPTDVSAQPLTLEASLPEPARAPRQKAASATDVNREAELLATAQRALAEGNAERALEVTRQHKALPRAVLVQERERIAIEALVRLGRASQASDRAARFRRSFPKSGYLPRIDSLFSNQEKSSGE